MPVVVVVSRKTYVRFVDISGGVEVQTLDGSVLGGIVYYARWRQCVFVPEYGSLFSFDCMEDIAAKVKDMNAARLQGALL